MDEDPSVWRVSRFDGVNVSAQEEDVNEFLRSASGFPSRSSRRMKQSAIGRWASS